MMPSDSAAPVVISRCLWKMRYVSLGLAIALAGLLCASCKQIAPPQINPPQVHPPRPTPPIATPIKESAEDELAFLSRRDLRAMWLWNEAPGSRAIIENLGGTQDTLLAFLRAPHGEPARAVNRLLFAAQAHRITEPLAAPHTLQYNPLRDPKARQPLQRFLRRLSDQGVATEMLAGQAIWLASDEFAQIPIQICRDTVDFSLASRDQAARFAGVHFDIEPHTVTGGPWAGEWWQDRLPDGYNAAWTRRWKQILNSCRHILNAYQTQTGQKLILSSDFGSDFAHYNQPMRNFLNRPDGPLDYLVVLNYFDNRDNGRGQMAFFHGVHDGEQVVGGVEQNMEYWTQIPVVFGVETGPETIAPDAASFYQEGYQSMYQTLDALLADPSSPLLIGVAIHHYGPDAYRDMKP